MNGIHDMGGMHGFGPVEREENEPVFHADWERRVFALSFAMRALKQWSVDEFRHAIERMGNAHYLNTSYYEHWLHGIEGLAIEKGLVTRPELDSGTPPAPRPPGVGAALTAEEAGKAIRRGRSTRVDAQVAPKFKPGDRIVVHNDHPAGHTRTPRYVRGKRGVIDRDHGVFVFPDSNARLEGPKPQHVYSVRFEARDVWGPAAAPKDGIYMDLWDDYLEPA